LLAANFGRSAPMICDENCADVERGTRSVSVEVARRIAAALDAKLQSILDAIERGR
jgi:hypothetical protein